MENIFQGCNNAVCLEQFLKIMCLKPQLDFYCHITKYIQTKKYLEETLETY